MHHKLMVASRESPPGQVFKPSHQYIAEDGGHGHYLSMKQLENPCLFGKKMQKQPFHIRFIAIPRNLLVSYSGYSSMPMANSGNPGTISAGHGHLDNQKQNDLPKFRVHHSLKKGHLCLKNRRGSHKLALQTFR